MTSRLMRAALRAVRTFSSEVRLRHFVTVEGWRLLLAATGKGAFIYMVGITVLSLLSAAISYPLTLKSIDLYRRGRPSAASGPPPARNPGILSLLSLL